MVEESPEVDYKYFIGENNFNPSEVVWENGPNRTIDAAASTAESTTPLLRSNFQFFLKFSDFEIQVTFGNTEKSG